MKLPGKLLLVAAAAAGLAGCQTQPPRNPALDNARAAVDQARSDPAVASGAAVELEQAQAALKRAEQAWQSDGDAGRTRHLAYLAAQRAQVASYVGAQRAAEARLAQAGTERERTLAQTRVRESQALAQMQVEQAQAEAQAAQRRAREAQQQMQSARQQAQQSAEQQAQQSAALQRELEDLKAQNTQRGVMLSLQDVLFDTGSATLKPGAQRTVDRLAEVMKEYPERRVLVEGFTDSRGSEEANLDLSRRRAEAFRQALVDRGVEASRIETQAYGEAYPVADNRNPAGRLQNRRVDVVFSDEQGRLVPR
jgi:outer membrane protein OmpA-like peptidoglycan-associated protein